MKKSLLSIVLIMYALVYVSSQEASSDVISSSGSSIVSEDFTLSWTIGENIIDFSQISPDAKSYEFHSGSITMDNGTLINVYPVITTGKINIDIESEVFEELDAELMSMKGSLVKAKILMSDKEEMDLTDLVYGMYMLRISDKQRKDMKIVKIIRQ